MAFPAPDIVVADWIDATGGALDATGGALDAPGYVERAKEAAAAAAQIDAAHFFEWKVADLAVAIEAAKQFELGLPARDVRLHARERVAEYLERVVLPDPMAVRPSLHNLPSRLRECRQEFRCGVRLSDGKRFARWDSKAGLPLLCPDDAREEAMRIQRRAVPRMLELRQQGMQAHTCVFTMPNAPAGKLHDAIRKLFLKFRRLLKMRVDGHLRFPTIRGALVVLEAPLGRRRDWHPHLNVILICDAYLSYEDLAAAWHWMVHIRPVDGSLDAVKASFRELIKYAVRAIPEKSEEKARAGSRQDDQGRAPAMIDWTAAEWLEWWNAHRGLRRTRGYGALYGLDEPPKEDTSQVVWIATVRRYGAGYALCSPLLESIPGDKSTTKTAKQIAIEAFRRVLGPPDLVARARAACKLAAAHYGPVSLAQE